MKRLNFVLLALIAFAGISAEAPRTARADGTVSTDPTPKAGWNFSELGSLPVQAGGRVKPLDSYARATSCCRLPAAALSADGIRSN